MDQLLEPINAEGLDLETLKKLYESKLVYLQNLRVKCFCEMNSSKPGFFSMRDYALIISALKETRLHLKELVLDAVYASLEAYPKQAG